MMFQITISLLLLIMDCTSVFPGTGVTVNLDGLGRTVTRTGMTVCQVLARMLARALIFSMVSPVNADKASEVRGSQK